MNKIETEYLDLEDIRIAYCQHGSGRNLLLLHGNSESKKLLEPYQLEYFPMFHTYALDSRGHGQSISDDDSLTIEQFCDDVINFCKAKGITVTNVIGYSDGGNIALWLAKKAPERFPRIIAISPNYLVSGTTDSSLWLFTNLFKIMKFLNGLGINMKKHMMRFDLMLSDIGLTDDDLREIHTLVKIIYAEKDMIKEEHFKTMASLIPNATLDKVANCTHMTIIKQPQAIEIMKTWLTSSSIE